MDAEPPIASFLKSTLIGGGPVNATVRPQFSVASIARQMDGSGKQHGRPQYSIGCLLLATAIFAVPVAGLSYLLHCRNACLVEVERRTTQALHTVQQIAIDVEKLCKKLGRAPKDQEELESLIGKSLPNVHDNGYPTPIHYWQTGDTSFMLQYELWATDDWIYDSAKPEAGWVQHWY